MGKPLFSIIVPVYKTENYLARCVESILNQSFPDFEAVLVDDGSPDGCPALCDRYAAQDTRLRVVHKRNGGLASARKAGLAVCRGTYIVNVDSDDDIAPDLLERLAEIVQTHQPEAILYGFYLFSENGQKTCPQKLAPGLYAGAEMEQIHRQLILGENLDTVVFNNVWSMAARYEKYQPCQMAVSEQISRGEDLAVTVPLLAGCERVYITDYCGYHYRSNPTSIMNTFRRDEMRQAKILSSYLTEKLGPDYESRIDAYITLEYYRYLKRGARLGGYRQFRQLVRETLDEEISLRIKRARCGKTAHFTNRLVFAFLRHGCFTALWLLWRFKE